MREHINATNFLILPSILTIMPNLKCIFVSERWLESLYCRKVEAEKAVKTIFDDRFAKVMEEIINVSFKTSISYF